MIQNVGKKIDRIVTSLKDIEAHNKVIQYNACQVNGIGFNHTIIYGAISYIL